MRDMELTPGTVFVALVGFVVETVKLACIVAIAYGVLVIAGVITR